jgi:serine/threonine protein kinase
MTTVDTVKGRYSSYQLLNDVGHGGSARVYRAHDLATKQEVAVKQLFGNRPQDREDWLREVDAITTLNKHHCPHVIHYLDHMQQHERLFLVEEFAQHGSLLRQLKQNGPMPEAKVCHYVFQVLTTLHRMSQWGFIHGDLKASNILLFDNDVVKLTDFALRSRGLDGEGSSNSNISPNRGSASTTAGQPHHHHTTIATTTKSSGSSTAAGATTMTSPPPTRRPPPLYEFRGSVYWAAPEVLAGESRATAASDIWAVACTVVELLTGAPPYLDRTVANATHHVLKSYYAAMEEAATEGLPHNEEDSDGTVAAASAQEAAAARNDSCSSSSIGSGDGSGRTNTATASASLRDSHNNSGTLMPPLPSSLHLSAECKSFLQQCFRLRACERPSAGALLQHPWFLDIVVPQLLQAAREGRVMTSSPGEEDGGNSNSNISSSGNAGNPGSRFAVIERWVKTNLLSDDAARCEAWLRSDALPLLVPVLTPRIMTPMYIGNVMRCFSHFADSNSVLASLFLERLGATELWSVDELTSACDSDHLTTLYRRCCAAQDPQVAVFTPTHPPALRFVLGLEKAKVQECVAALHHLIVGGPATTPPVITAAPSMDTVVDVASTNAHDTADSNVVVTSQQPDEQDGIASQEHHHPQRQHQQLQQRRERARARLLRHGGAGVLCQCVEAQCKAAFLNAAPPSLEWSTINAFLEILASVEPLPGGQALLWGFPSEGSRRPTSSRSTAAALLATGRADAVVASSSGNSGNDGNTTNNHNVNGGKGSGPTTGAASAADNSTTTSNNTQNHRRSAAPGDAAPSNTTPPKDATDASESHGAAANNTNITATAMGTHSSNNNSCSSNFGDGSFTPPVEDDDAAGAGAATTSTVVEWSSSLVWMLAVQEAAHHGCEAAVRLLTRYIPAATEVRADYLDKAGVSLTATLVLVASSEDMPVELRCAVVDCLPHLQTCSLRAARYLRDPIRCVPLLALTLQQSTTVASVVMVMPSSSPSSLTKSLVAALHALTRDKQTLAAYAGSPWMWAALLSLIKEAAAHAGKGRADSRAAADEANPRQQHQREEQRGAKEDDKGDRADSNAAPPSRAAGVAPSADASDPAAQAARATLIDLLYLMSQWLAEVSPAALISVAATVSTRNTASPPPPPLSPSSAAVAAAAHQPRGPHPTPASPPSLSVLLQRLRALLTELSHNTHVCSGEVGPQVGKALDYLGLLDASLSPEVAPATAAATT